MRRSHGLRLSADGEKPGHELGEPAHRISSYPLEELGNGLGQYVPPAWAKNGAAQSAGQIEIDNYLEAMFRQAQRDPAIVDRLIERYSNQNGKPKF